MGKNPNVYFIIPCTFYRWLEDVDRRYHLKLDENSAVVDYVTELFVKAIAHRILHNGLETKLIAEEILKELTIYNKEEVWPLLDIIDDYVQSLYSYVMIDYDTPIVIKPSVEFIEEEEGGDIGDKEG